MNDVEHVRPHDIPDGLLATVPPALGDAETVSECGTGTVPAGVLTGVPEEELPVSVRVAAPPPPQPMKTVAITTRVIAQRAVRRPPN